ncbi:MAG: ATP-binding protein [bacterium]|nr:ATP-binding protein [bacterium]
MLPGTGSPLFRHSQELPLLLKILMVFRVATVTLFLGGAVVIQLKGSQALFFAPLFTIYLLVVGVYLLTILFATIFNQVENLPRFAAYQVGVDLLIYTFVVFLTGGHSSPFPFLFLFSILWASLALHGGGYWTASVSSILYGGVVDLQYYSLVMPPQAAELADLLLVNPWDIMGRVFMHITAFFAVAFLGHMISHRYRAAREELSEKTVDLEKLRTLSDVVFESITSGIAVLDREGAIRSMNSAAEKMLSLEGRMTRTGRRPKDVFSGIPIQDLLQRASAGRVDRWEGSFTDEEDEDRVLGLSISPLKEPEKGFVVIFQDLTKLREMEGKLRVSEKLSAIGRMAASIAHEVRNPLASMSGSIQILKKDLDLHGEDLRLMDIVLKETQRLNDLLGNFLDYARPPSPRFEDVDLRDIVSDTVNFLDPVATAGEISLETDLPAEPVILSLDVSQMRQILMNLVKNAADAVSRGGRITVSVVRDDNGGGSVLAVSDDGPGIPDEVLPEIFEPFKTTKDHGTGLGLAIVYQLVQIHKGTIDVRTEEGRGTTVSVNLPPWRSH